MDKVCRFESAGFIKGIFIELLRNGCKIRVNVQGRSMSSFIKRGEFVIIKPIRFEEVEVGDILVYCREKTENMFTTHRLIKKGMDGDCVCLFTKGDANRFGDSPIYAEDVYGKVIEIERNGRIINLETKFNRLRGYLIACISRGQLILRTVKKTPHLIPIKVWRKIWNYGKRIF